MLREDLDTLDSGKPFHSHGLPMAKAGEKKVPGKDKPERGSTGKNAPKKGKTGFCRMPGDMFEMVDMLAQHRHTSHAAVMDDPRCPFRAWLIEESELVIKEKSARLAALKKQQGEG